MQTASPDLYVLTDSDRDRDHKAWHRAHDQLGGVGLLLLGQARVHLGLGGRADFDVNLDAEAAEDEAFLGWRDRKSVGHVVEQSVPSGRCRGSIAW